MLFNTISVCYTVEITHKAYHYGVCKHTIVLVAESPLVEVTGQGEAQRTGSQLYVVVDLGTQREVIV